MVGFSSPRGGICQWTIAMETDDEYVEAPLLRRPHHGENREAVSKPKDAQGRMSLEVCNDLQVAIEVNPGTGWKVMYPEERFRLDTFQPVNVAARLRDDPDICGTCRVGATALLRATESFGNSFGPAAVKFIEAEQEASLQKLKDQLLDDDRYVRHFLKRFFLDGNSFDTADVILWLVVLCVFLAMAAWYVLEREAGVLTPASAVVVILSICALGWMALMTWSKLMRAKRRSATEVKLLGEEIERSCSHRCIDRFFYIVLVLLTAFFVLFTVVCCSSSPRFAVIFGPAWLWWCWWVMAGYWTIKHFQPFKMEGNKEVELDAATWTCFEPSPPSPKVIGVATEP